MGKGAYILQCDAGESSKWVNGAHMKPYFNPTKWLSSFNVLYTDDDSCIAVDQIFLIGETKKLLLRLWPFRNSGEERRRLRWVLGPSDVLGVFGCRSCGGTGARGLWSENPLPHLRMTWVWE